MAITAWSAKVVSSSICLSVNDRGGIDQIASQRSEAGKCVLMGLGVTEVHEHTVAPGRDSNTVTVAIADINPPCVKGIGK